jgi:PA domain-containing protein/flagellar hook capping protein FlgD
MRARRDGTLRGTLPAIGLAVLAAGLLAGAAGGTTITIVNLDGAGEGLNDPTPVAPVGGNPGTTVGAQRLYVLQYAADVWESVLTSSVEIRVQAAFNPLTCTATSGTLGSAGPINVVRDFPNAPLGGHWYHVALANRLAGSDQIPGSNDINTQLNSSVGQTGCLETSSWYYGVDTNPGAGQIDLLQTVLHEYGHGLGFSTTTSGSSGNYSNSFPHIYDHFLYDNSLGLHWDQMTPAERVASANACSRLVWDGASAVAHGPAFLGDKPVLRVNAPPGIAGDYDVGTAAFGPPLTSSPVTADVVLVDDGTGTTTDGCEALINAGAVSGKIALIDRGTCPFVQKVENAENAGAIGVIIVDNVAGCPPAGLGGVAPAVTIPSLRVTLADGNTIKANLPGVNVSLTRNPDLVAGADAAGRPKVYTPSTFAGGSSVSHWDTSADPNLLMEPFATPLGADLVDLTRWHFADIGWFDGLTAVGEPVAAATPRLSSAPNPFARSTTIRMAMKAEGEAELSIFDLAGRRLAVLHRGVLPAGDHSFEWRGLDASGHRLPPGIYLSRVSVEGVSEGVRLIMWR